MTKVRPLVQFVLVGLAVILAAAGCSVSRASETAADPTRTPAADPPRPAATGPWPVTSLHYAPNDNFSPSGRYLP
jgi:hypothetical protein